MKKICTVLIILFLIFALVGCSLSSNWNQNNDNDFSYNGGSNQTPDGGNDKPIIGDNDNSNVGGNDNTNFGGNNDDDNKQEEFNDYGFPVIEINLLDYNVEKYGIYTSMAEVGGYIYLYHGLPSNFYPKSDRVSYTPQNKASVGGDRFYNREGILPNAKGRTYTECDIDYKGGGRNAKRIVYSSDFLIFYTSDHYESFSILRFYVD